jgi:hypothetical protein
VTAALAFGTAVVFLLLVTFGGRGVFCLGLLFGGGVLVLLVFRVA